MKIVIYSKDECSFCDKARELLKSLGKDFLEYKLEKDFTRETIKTVFPDARTFPVVTIDNEFIGGYTELAERFK